MSSLSNVKGKKKEYEESLLMACLKTSENVANGWSKKFKLRQKNVLPLKKQNKWNELDFIWYYSFIWNHILREKFENNY